jgi:hypothetical protein
VIPTSIENPLPDQPINQFPQATTPT